MNSAIQEVSDVRKNDMDDEIHKNFIKQKLEKYKKDYEPTCTVEEFVNFDNDFETNVKLTDERLVDFILEKNNTDGIVETTC